MEGALCKERERGGSDSHKEREREREEETYPPIRWASSPLHVLYLVHNVFGPVVHCPVHADSCSTVCVDYEPVNSCGGLAAERERERQCHVRWALNEVVKLTFLTGT